MKNKEKVIEILRKTRDLLEAPERWAQGYSAKDTKGFLSEVESPNAVCWCLFGGLMRSGDLVGNASAKVTALCEIENTIGGNGIVDWNDSSLRRHSDVLLALDQTIERVVAS